MGLGTFLRIVAVAAVNGIVWAFALEYVTVTYFERPVISRELISTTDVAIATFAIVFVITLSFLCIVRANEK